MAKRGEQKDSFANDSKDNNKTPPGNRDRDDDTDDSDGNGVCICDGGWQASGG
jgi:hypothetical protein